MRREKKRGGGKAREDVRGEVNQEVELASSDYSPSIHQTSSVRTYPAGALSRTILPRRSPHGSLTLRIERTVAPPPTPRGWSSFRSAADPGVGTEWVRFEVPVVGSVGDWRGNGDGDGARRILRADAS